MTVQTLGHLKFIGMLEQFIPPRGLTGWVGEASSSFNEPIDLVILSGDKEIGRVTSDALRERPDAPGTMARGYGTHVVSDLSYGDFARSAVKVCPINEDGSFGEPLPYHPLLAMLGRVGDGLLALSELRDATDHLFKMAFDRLSSSSILDYSDRSPLTPMRTLWGARHLYHRLIHDQVASGKDCDFTPILVPVGIKSGDGSALLGRDGFVFLIGGSNNFMDSYLVDESAKAVVASLLVFGNSFVGTAGKAQNSLSFWLARMFREYHFVWCSDISDDLVRKLKPDIVIGQTIERFLSEIPLK